jgi:hypothetical protein
VIWIQKRQTATNEAGDALSKIRAALIGLPTVKSISADAKLAKHLFCAHNRVLTSGLFTSRIRDVATAVRVVESSHSVGVYVLPRSPSADFGFLIASISRPGITNGKGPSARDLSGYKAVSGQPLCSAISISREASAGDFWFGSDRLWTAAPVNGTWRGLPHYTLSDPTFRQKLAFDREGYDWHTEPQPRLKVTGKRLGARPKIGV